MAKVKLYGTKEVRAAAYNRMAARYFLHLAEQSEEGQFFTAQASLLFSAFTHEAFLNTLCPKVISCWKAVEFLSPYEKLSSITATLQYKPVFGERPYQTLQSLFEFRNAIAHGREEEMKLDGNAVTKSQSTRRYVEAVESKWVAYCTLQNARRAFEDVEKIAIDLSEHAKVEKMPSYPFGSPESAQFKVVEKSVKQEPQQIHTLAAEPNR